MLENQNIFVIVGQGKSLQGRNNSNIRDELVLRQLLDQGEGFPVLLVEESSRIPAITHSMVIRKGDRAYLPRGLCEQLPFREFLQFLSAEGRAPISERIRISSDCTILITQYNLLICYLYSVVIHPLLDSFLKHVLL